MGRSQTINERNEKSRTCPSLSGIKFNVIFSKNLLSSLHLVLTLKEVLTKFHYRLSHIFSTGLLGNSHLFTFLELAARYIQ